MKPLNKAGFTIVETMLFLGVSALLIVGILVGTGSAINIQRYRDSVVSFQSFLQKQYSEVSNVSNNRTLGDLPCGSTIAVPIGQSDCVILGRFITTDNSKSLSIKNVVGEQKNINEMLSSNDVTALRQYDIFVSDVGSSVYDIEWGASIADTAGKSKKFSMLILRSPSSGVTRTFLDDSVPLISESQISNLLTVGGDTPTSLSKTLTLCVDSDGMFTGTKMSIVINANTTSASGIETFGDDSGCK